MRNFEKTKKEEHDFVAENQFKEVIFRWIDGWGECKYERRIVKDSDKKEGY